MLNHPKKGSISVYLVIYNEEKVLERCLQSVKSIADEIIVIHDGPCADQSLEIARRYTDKLFIEEHLGFGEFHRIKAMQEASCEWVLQIDADEFLSADAIEQIPRLVQSTDIDGYSFLWRLWDGAKYVSDGFPHKNTLFRKSKMYYIVFPQTEMKSYGNVVECSCHLEHRPTYNNYTLATFRKKWLRWIKIHAASLLQTELQHYNADDEALAGLRRRMAKQVKYASYWLAPAWGVIAFVNVSRSHGYYKSAFGWRVAWLQALYGFSLCIYLARLKHAKN